MALGISYISVYDLSGICVQNKQLIQAELEQHQKLVSRQNGKNRTFDVHLHTSGSQSRNRARDRHRARDDVDIQLLSLADSGRQSLVRVAADLSHAVLTTQKALTDITPSSVDRILQDESGFPDPDLVLQFGVSDCLLGFLPWQMRLTEILSLKTHKQVDYHTIYAALKSFSYINQRLGK